jgi:hypothetical protein
MKVRLTTDRAGHGYTQYAGQEIDVATEEGGRMITSGQAELIEKRIETAAIDHRSRERRNQKPIKR